MYNFKMIIHLRSNTCRKPRPKRELQVGIIQFQQIHVNELTNFLFLRSHSTSGKLSFVQKVSKIRNTKTVLHFFSSTDGVRIGGSIIHIY